MPLTIFIKFKRFFFIIFASHHFFLDRSFMGLEICLKIKLPKWIQLNVHPGSQPGYIPLWARCKRSANQSELNVLPSVPTFRLDSLSTVVSAIQGWGYPRPFLFGWPGPGPMAMPLTTNVTAHPQTHVFHSCPAKIALVFEVSKWVEASKLLALMDTPLQWLMRFHNEWFCNNNCTTLLHYLSFPLLVPRGACWTDIGSRVLSLNNTPYLNADLPSLKQRGQSHRGIWT